MPGVERERVAGGEPSRDRRFQGGQQVAPGVQEREPGPAAQPLQDAGGVQVAPQIVQVERDDAGAVVVVDERQRPTFASHRADGLRVDERAGPVEHPVHHHHPGPVVDRPVVLLERDREAVRRAEPLDLDAAAPLREPDVAVGGEVELGQHDLRTGRRVERRGDRRERDRDVRGECHLLGIAVRER